MVLYSETALQIIDELHTELLDYESEYIPLIEAAQRLEEYEKTGFEPQEIEEQKFFIAAQKDPDKLKRLRELVEADADGRCIVPPVGIGDTVYHITTCENFYKVLDGTMYDADGGAGTATGYYCPCELSENCPFPLDNEGGFDCDEHKKELGVFEDIVEGIVVDEAGEYITLGYSGSVDFCEFGKTLFREKEAAVSARKEMR